MIKLRSIKFAHRVQNIVQFYPMFWFVVKVEKANMITDHPTAKRVEKIAAVEVVLVGWELEKRVNLN